MVAITNKWVGGAIAPPTPEKDTDTMGEHTEDAATGSMGETWVKTLKPLSHNGNWGRGDTFAVTRDDARKLVLLGHCEYVPPPEAKPEPKEWKMNLAPEIYLQRFPEGPQAELARELVESRDPTIEPKALRVAKALEESRAQAEG